MRLEFHPDTAKDVRDAVRYLENQRPGLADEFQLEVSEALDRICANPSRLPPKRVGVCEMGATGFATPSLSFCAKLNAQL